MKKEKKKLLYVNFECLLSIQHFVFFFSFLLIFQHKVEILIEDMTMARCAINPGEGGPRRLAGGGPRGAV